MTGDAQKDWAPDDIDFYCAAYPDYCKPPFNCREFLEDVEAEYFKWGKEGAAADGKPNYFNWCMQPATMPFMSKCAVGNLIGAAKTRYFLTENGMFGGLMNELDGSFCFMEGHCAADVNENTTVEETAKFCDERYGHEVWTQVGSTSAPPENMPGFGMDSLYDQRNGFVSPSQTRPYSLTACAFGSIHCDIVYCKENYCKDEYYVKKYGHLLYAWDWDKRSA